MSLFDALLLDPAPFHIWIAYRSDNLSGSGTVSDPYNGGGVDFAGVSNFDKVMQRFVGMTNVVVHLGPTPVATPFLTSGFYDGLVGSGWQIQPGMKILGSGIDVTVLKLMDAAGTSGKVVYAIGHALSSAGRVDYCEVSDLTIDSNLAATGAASRGRGAIRLMGSHTRIRRVRAKNWGTRNTSTPGFVFSLITALPSSSPAVTDIVNTGMEECYADSPGSGVGGDNNNTITTIFNVSGPDDTAVSAEAHAKSPFIRNCYVDAGVAAPVAGLPITSRASFRAISMGWCRGGVVEGNQIYNVDVAGPYQGLRSVRDIIVRNNFCKNVARGPYFDLGQATTLSGTPTISWTGSVGLVNGINAAGMAYLGNGDRKEPGVRSQGSDLNGS